MSKRTRTLNAVFALMAIAVVACAMMPQAMSQDKAAGLSGRGTCTCYNTPNCPSDFCAAGLKYYTCSTAKNADCDCKLNSSDHPCGATPQVCANYNGLSSGNQCGVGNC
jgi:hypothetical protein